MFWNYVKRCTPSPKNWEVREITDHLERIFRKSYKKESDVTKKVESDTLKFSKL